MYDVRTKLAREVLCELKKGHAAQMFRTIVNFNTKLKEAASFGQPITEYDPNSKGMKDFMALANEIINAAQTQPAEKKVESVKDQLRAISKTADELLEESKQLIGTKPAPAQKVDTPEKTIEEKIDRFYGVRQKRDKIEFAALYPQAKTVLLAGDFNNWQPDVTPMTKTSANGRWEILLPLAGGTHQYRYVVDGRWQQDPYNKLVTENEFGEFNSLVEVK